MRPRTPSFVGSRLREAREARGLTGVTLAELVELTPQIISKYERDERTPGPEALRALASTLHMPVMFFTMPKREEGPESPVFFRSMAATTKGARKRASWRLDWLQDVTAYLEELVDFPPVNLPELCLASEPALLSDDDIEDAAATARAFWSMSDTAPIANVVRLLENQGVVVARQALGADTLDGLSTFGSATQRPFVMIATDKGTAVRWRFDAAHELGHLLLHKGRRAADLGDTAKFKLIERQAHRFAAAFLLPMEPFLEDLYGLSLDVMAAMKPRWKVSIAMMIMRARDAGVLTESAEKRLWMNYRRRFGRQEPYDDVLEPEMPALLRRAAELVLSEARGAHEMLARIALSPRDIEGLCGLPSGYLNQDFAPVTLRTRFVAGSEEREDLAQPARVIDFRPRRAE